MGGQVEISSTTCLRSTFISDSEINKQTVFYCTVNHYILPGMDGQAEFSRLYHRQ